MAHTGPVPDSNDKTLAESASTWMQVVFGGLGVCIAIVALVIAYFAWVQPHSPDGDSGPAGPAPAATSKPVTREDASGTAVALGGLTPSIGAGNVRRAGDDLVIPCASGQSDDRLRKIEYDLRNIYTGMETEVHVSKARDDDTPLQLKIVSDGAEDANKILKKGDVTRLSVTLVGRKKMRLQLTCEFSDGELTLGSPKLIHP
jgi:hypothetical protein